MLTLRLRSVLLAAALALGPCGSARAHPRELELSRVYEHPVFAAVGGLGVYNPDSSADGTSLELAAGVRFIKPYERDATYDFSATQASVRHLLSDSEDLTTFELSFSNYLPRTSLFTFDHHFFYGAGLGSVIVERPGTESLSLPIGTLSFGLQSRLAHVDIESSVKLVLGPRRAVYDASGTVTQIALVYPLGY
jgi:hypothetical protein